jgi:hypothetical protein
MHEFLRKTQPISIIDTELEIISKIDIKYGLKSIPQIIVIPSEFPLEYIKDVILKIMLYLISSRPNAADDLKDLQIMNVLLNVFPAHLLSRAETEIFNYYKDQNGIKLTTIGANSR